VVCGVSVSGGFLYGGFTVRKGVFSVIRDTYYACT